MCAKVLRFLMFVLHIDACEVGREHRAPGGCRCTGVTCNQPRYMGQAAPLQGSQLRLARSGSARVQASWRAATKQHPMQLAVAGLSAAQVSFTPPSCSEFCSAAYACACSCAGCTARTCGCSLRPPPCSEAAHAPYPVCHARWACVRAEVVLPTQPPLKHKPNAWFCIAWRQPVRASPPKACRLAY